MLERYKKPLFFYGLSLIIPWILWFIVAYFSHQRNQSHIASVLIPSLGVLGLISPVLFGHSLSQFYISGKPSFDSFIFSPWFILIFAPIVEKLVWHSYGTDTLRRKFNLFKYIYHFCHIQGILAFSTCFY